jgi:hypothetical protein
MTAVERRRVMIAMARRRQRPGSGSSLDFLRTRTTTMRFPDLSRMLGGVPWAVIGAAATRLYMPERKTSDLDVLVSSRSGAVVRERNARVTWC